MIEAQGQAQHEQDRDAFVTRPMQFHRSFIGAAGNGLLLTFADRLSSRQAVMLHLSLPSINSAAEESVAQHRLLFEACRQCDFDRSTTLMQHHMSDKLALRYGPA